MRCRCPGIIAIIAFTGNLLENLRSSKGRGKQLTIMDTKKYVSATGVIFAVIAVFHALRVFYGWSVNLGDWDVPMWVSYMGVVVAGFLAYEASRLKRRG